MEKSQHPKRHLRKHSGEKSTSKKTFEKTQWNKVKILQPILPGSSSSSYQRQSGLQSHSKHAKRHLRKHSGENTVAKHSGEKSKSKKTFEKTQWRKVKELQPLTALHLLIRVPLAFSLLPRVARCQGPCHPMMCTYIPLGRNIHLSSGKNRRIFGCFISGLIHFSFFLQHNR